MPINIPITSPGPVLDSCFGGWGEGDVELLAGDWLWLLVPLEVDEDVESLDCSLEPPALGEFDGAGLLLGWFVEVPFVVALFFEPLPALEDEEPEGLCCACDEVDE